MRKVLIGLAVLTVLAAACAPQDDTTGSSGSETGAAPADAKSCASSSDVAYTTDNALTIGTGNPAYPPWFEGGEQPGTEWKINDPSNDEGFESAVAYAVARQMGFEDNQVAWVPVPFNASFAPGPKDFDFVLQQISYSAKRAQAVDFSDSYYDVNQALVSTKGSSIANATTLEELKDAKLGAPIGTTSLDYITDTIQPNVEPNVYDSLNAAVQDLKNGQVDGVVVDLPTAFYITAVQVPDGVIVGQFPTEGQQEYFAMAFPKGSALVQCVNLALDELKADGSLDAIQQKWLSDKASAPVIAA
jgi:polar amino acid transport system substrate-binding protein